LKEGKLKKFWKYRILSKTKPPDVYPEAYEEEGFKAILWLSHSHEDCALLWQTKISPLRIRIADKLEKPWGKRPRRLLQTMFMEFGYSGAQNKFLVLSDNLDIANTIVQSSEFNTIEALGYEIIIRRFNE
tara:strand:+ start:5548 stop:5937 length:390 start_codon:yes stop_codon:yes gene_type:complete